jgi:hypothetical protein
MSVNRERPYLLILPEDRRNHQIATGFQIEFGRRQLQVLPVAGGWARVRDDFIDDYVGTMKTYPESFILLLVDFDDQPSRRDAIRNRIAENLRDRVFIIGTLSKPERLSAAIRSSYENIGRSIAKDCRQGNRDTFSHPLLLHNISEVDRLCLSLSAIF